MLQRLPIALVQVKGGNISKNSLNEIRKTNYSMYQAKEITKIVYNKYNEFNKGKMQKSILFLWTLKIVKHLIITDYYSILQIK